MSPVSDHSKKIDGKLFLKSLKEDGIEEVYLEPKRRPAPAKPAASASIHSHPEARRAEGSQILRFAQDDTKSAKHNPLPGRGPGEGEDKTIYTGTGLSGEESNQAMKELLALRQKASACRLCQELCSTRKNVVFGAGNVEARLLFVGEAPGRDEDLQGFPFVGRAGQLLTKIIESIGFSRQQVFIANTLKCRPPNNRPPQPEELSNCAPFLTRQIELIQPKIICALGTFAARGLLKTEETISKLRGRFHEYQGIKLICTFHPAYLLRNPSEKRTVWEDMKTIKRELEALR